MNPTRQTGMRGRLGLTLIEVLMALAIMGIGIAGLVAAASRCLAVARKAKHYENTRQLLGEAEMKWQEYLLERDEEEEALEADSETWSYPPPFEQYRGSWTLEEVSEDSEDETAGLFKLALRVSWSEYGKESYEEVMTYVFSPDESKSGSVTTTQ